MGSVGTPNFNQTAFVNSGGSFSFLPFNSPYGKVEGAAVSVNNSGQIAGEVSRVTPGTIV